MDECETIIRRPGEVFHLPMLFFIGVDGKTGASHHRQTEMVPRASASATEGCDKVSACDELEWEQTNGRDRQLQLLVHHESFLKNIWFDTELLSRGDFSSPSFSLMPITLRRPRGDLYHGNKRKIKYPFLKGQTQQIHLCSDRLDVQTPRKQNDTAASQI